jgi:hypothetical protein
MIKPGLAFVSTSTHKLPDFGSSLDLRTRSAHLLLLPRPRQSVQACSYRREILHRGCHAVVRGVINLI